MKTKLIAAFASVFLAGAAVGSIATILRVQRTSQEEVQVQAWVKTYETKLTTQLKLTPEQQSRLRPMLEATARQLSLRLEMFSKEGMTVMKGFDDQLNAILSEEQRAVHRAMKKPK